MSLYFVYCDSFHDVSSCHSLKGFPIAQ